MRLRDKVSLLCLLTGAAFVVAIPIIGPAISQEAPESILPPGFGDEVDEPDAPPSDRNPDRPRGPTDLVPRLGTEPGDGGDDEVTGGAPRKRPRPTTQPSGESIGGDVVASSSAPGEEGDAENPDGTAMTTVGRMDLPPEAQRSMAVVGVLGETDGDMGVNAFGGFHGKYLSGVMRKIKAPIASRWSSILLRRALLSQSATPSDVNGGDWVAERAWLLLRMGEADAARMLIQAVDTDNYTPKMLQVAMQVALANADPAGMCNIASKGEAEFDEASWPLASAMCAGLSGESARANASIDRVRSKRLARGVDVLLAEKVVAAGANTRRAIMIQWDDVKTLNAWRYGLASATGLAIPDRLMGTVGPRVEAWKARSTLLPVQDRIVPSEAAAAFGVLSSKALVDLYSAWYDSVDPSERAGKPFSILRTAYTGTTVAARMTAMKSLWTAPKMRPQIAYARSILTAQAAARIRPSADLSADAAQLISSMLSAGLDTSAARWTDVASNASDKMQSWALLAVGSPDPKVDISAGKVNNYASAAGDQGGQRAALLFAGLAGLGRLEADDINSIAESMSIPIGRRSTWTNALDLAVRSRSPGNVALLCSAGLQTSDWKNVPAAQLYHVVSALRRSGFEAEARMIAVEAITRT